MKRSLRKKSLILIVISAIILCGAMIILSYRIVSNLINTEYNAKALNMSETLAVTIDVDAARRVKNAVADIYDAAENLVGSEVWGSDAWNEYKALFSDVEKRRVVFIHRQHFRKYFPRLHRRSIRKWENNNQEVRWRDI